MSSASERRALVALQTQQRVDGADLPIRPADEVVLLIGHGTRDLAGAAEFRAFAAEVAAKLDDGRRVVPCFLELSTPSILSAIGSCYAQGARRITAVPLLLFGANHVKNDIPTAINHARAHYPDLELRYGAPLGLQPELLAVVDERLAALTAALPARPRSETAVLLVERGSSDPDANGQVYHLARLLWEGRDFGWVEPCFIGITRPSLQEGLARCAALGARRVLVLPYFLFTGVLVQRIERVVAVQAREQAGLEFAVAHHLGQHPELIALTLRRIAEAGQGEVRMSCDRCKYRVALAGFEHQVGQPQRSDHGHGLRMDTDSAHDHGPAGSGHNQHGTSLDGAIVQ